MKKLAVIYFCYILIINCSRGELNNSPASELQGKWNLESIDLKSENSSNTLIPLDVLGKLSFSNSGYLLSISIRYEGVRSTGNDAGTFIRSGSRVSFIPSGGNTFTGNVFGDKLSIRCENFKIGSSVFEEVTYSFVKENS